MALSAPQVQLTAATPDRVIMALSGLPEDAARYMSIDAVQRARMTMPRVTGATASRLQPFYGRNFFGIWFPDSHTWFMEHGTKGFTMRSLAGKTIPMWIDDPDGSVQRQNPKSETRTTDDGRMQVKIFRKAAPIGKRKINRKRDKVTGMVTTWTSPASFPGAPGRINKRISGATATASQRPGAISLGNGGVKWRHPGLRAMGFLNSALATVAFESGFLIQPVYVADGATWELINRRTS
jgi:hypothetical protein